MKKNITYKILPDPKILRGIWEVQRRYKNNSMYEKIPGSVLLGTGVFEDKHLTGGWTVTNVPGGERVNRRAVQLRAFYYQHCAVSEKVFVDSLISTLGMIEKRLPWASMGFFYNTPVDEGWEKFLQTAKDVWESTRNLSVYRMHLKKTVVGAIEHNLETGKKMEVAARTLYDWSTSKYGLKTATRSVSVLNAYLSRNNKPIRLEEFAQERVKWTFCLDPGGKSA